MSVEPSSIKWCTSKGMNRPLETIRRLCTPEQYAENKQALKDLLCSYFSERPDCDAKFTGGISPIGHGPSGWKRIKMRWVYPGSGKSGGLRIALAVHCDKRRVVLAAAYRRHSAPDNDGLADALKGAGV